MSKLSSKKAMSMTQYKLEKKNKWTKKNNEESHQSPKFILLNDETCTLIFK